MQCFSLACENCFSFLLFSFLFFSSLFTFSLFFLFLLLFLFSSLQFIFWGVFLLPITLHLQIYTDTNTDTYTDRYIHTITYTSTHLHIYTYNYISISTIYCLLIEDLLFTPLYPVCFNCPFSTRLFVQNFLLHPTIHPSFMPTSAFDFTLPHQLENFPCFALLYYNYPVQSIIF